MQGEDAQGAEQLRRTMLYERKPENYWNDFAHVEAELLAFIEEYGTLGVMPIEKELFLKGRGDLAKGIMKMLLALPTALKHSKKKFSGFASFILIAGYGYRFERTFLTYLAVISGFATMYYLAGVHDIDAHNKPGPHHLSWYEALIVSMTAFHRRGFFVGTFSPGDPQALIAAIEAFIGLLIEVIFIATLTRRLFTQ